MWRDRCRDLYFLLLCVALHSVQLSASEELIPRGSTWRYMKGTGEASSPPAAWREPEFDHGAWPLGSAPFRYGDGSGGTVLDDMRNSYTSVFLRQTFVVPDVAAVEGLRLTADYDDGLIIWINGVEVLDANGPAVIAVDEVASGSHESGTYENFVLGDPAEYLVEGTNVMAIQGFNVSPTSSDFVVDVALYSVRLVGDTTFDGDRGFATEPFEVAVTTETPGAVIAYTTDGSWPSPDHGTRYTEPISITKTTVLRAVAFMEDGSLDPSNVDTQTYLFLDVPVNRFGDEQPAYPPEVRASLLSLPAISLVMDNDDFETVRDNGSGGIGSSGGNKQWERPCSVELIYPPDFPGRGRGFQENCGVRPHSWTGTNKRSLKLVFKKMYGAGKLKYPVFESAPWNSHNAARSFDKLILRANSNDGYESRWGGSSSAIYVRDQFARDIQTDMGGVGSHGIFAHLFVNGEYWGVYNPCERPDHDFLASYYGGDDDDYYSFNHGGTINGDPAIHDHMHELARTRDLSDPAAYEEFKAYLNVGQFCDYLLANFYCTNPDHDWPINGSRPQNFYGGNRIVPPGPVEYYTWDSEFSLRRSARVHVNFRPSSGTKDALFMAVWFALLEQPDFRMLFADRAYRHLYNGGALTAEVGRARLAALTDAVRPSIPAEVWRWQGLGSWEDEVDEAFQTIDGNVVALIADMRSVGYYPAVDPPLFSQNGGIVPEGSQVSLENPAGAGIVYYALGGADPRAPGTGAVSADAVRYTDPITIAQTTVVKARLYDGGEWSAVAEGIFHTPQDLPSLRITEIMYNPVGNGPIKGKEYEFIELKNTGMEVLDLTNVSCGAGVSFSFPEGSILLPGSFAVLVVNESAFSERYPAVSVAGVYQRDLGNEGDTIELRGPCGELLTSVTYGDAAPWPTGADGEGYSLVPMEPNGSADPNDAATWRLSYEIGGSPGADDIRSTPQAPSILAEPQDVTVGEGHCATFTVTATGDPAPTYQWRRDGDDLPGETNPSYVTSPVVPGDNGARFQCVVSNTEGSVTSREATVTVLPAARDFIRGDTNGDGSVNIADAINILMILFRGFETTCADTVDTNDDGAWDLADAIGLLTYFFYNTTPPRPPYPTCGPDETPDELSCAAYSACR